MSSMSDAKDFLLVIAMLYCRRILILSLFSSLFPKFSIINMNQFYNSEISTNII